MDDFGTLIILSACTTATCQNEPKWTSNFDGYNKKYDAILDSTR